MVSYGYYGQHAARIGLDCICRIWLSASDSVPFFQRRHGSCCANWPGSDLMFQIWFSSGRWCQVLAKMTRPGSKLVCKNHVACFWADPDWMQIGSDMFTGRLSFCPLLGGSRSGSTKRQVKRLKITFQSTVGECFGFHWSWSAFTSACMYLSFHAKCRISCLF